MDINNQIKNLYLENNGKCCPFCMSAQVQACTLGISDMGLLEQRLVCAMCQSIWCNRYRLVSVEISPFFTHDCVHCVYLGSYDGNDLYYCDAGGEQTVIARYGNDPDENKSGIIFQSTDRHLTTAASRANLFGLAELKEKQTA